MALGDGGDTVTRGGGTRRSSRGAKMSGYPAGGGGGAACGAAATGGCATGCGRLGVGLDDASKTIPLAYHLADAFRGLFFIDWDDAKMSVHRQSPLPLGGWTGGGGSSGGGR